MTIIRIESDDLGSLEAEATLREVWADSLADPLVQAWLREQGVVEPQALNEVPVKARREDDTGTDALGAVLIEIGTHIIKTVAAATIIELVKTHILPRLSARMSNAGTGSVRLVAAGRNEP